MRIYEEIISSLHYAISMDFGISYQMFYDYICLVAPTFATVLGIRLGAWFLKQIIQ